MNLLKITLRRRGLLATLGLLFLAQIAHASNWWNDEWSYRKKITLDATATGIAIAEPIGTAPVLVRLHAGNFQFGVAREDGLPLGGGEDSSSCQSTWPHRRIENHGETADQSPP